MALYKPFLNIYRLIDRVKTNKAEFPHVYQRLQALEKLAIFLEQEDESQISQDVKEALKKLSEVLETAENFIQRFSDARMLNQMVKSNSYRTERDSLNKSLNDAFVTLSAALHIYQGKKLAEQEERLSEQEGKLDRQEERLSEQEGKLDRQEERLSEQEGKLDMQDERLAEQERRLAEQEDRLVEHADVMQRAEATLAYLCETRAIYCVLL